MTDSTHPTPLHYVLPTMLVLVGLIHLLPVSGVLGSAQLAKLYGIAFTEPNAAILMRHRAVLFGLLGVFLVVAAFRPALQAAALVAGFVSVASFLWLAWSVGGYNDQVGRVCVADGVALLCLVVGAVAWVGGGYRQLGGGCAILYNLPLPTPSGKLLPSLWKLLYFSSLS